MPRRRISLPLTGDAMNSRIEQMDKDTFARWCQAALDDNYYTDDGPELLKNKFQYVFVYGTLKKGFSRNHVITRHINEPIGPATTVGTGYIMYRTGNKYTYPVILHSTEKSAMGAIAGEVWKVPSKTMFELDFIESNGEMYDRTKIPVEVLLGPQRKPVKMMAWTYIGRQSFWRDSGKNTNMPKLVSCDLLSRNNNPNFKYYTFMRKYAIQAEAA
jgi:gamma-glutamylcyclotransferase (GGCT)/AIG2-like uncharacterized protein YtfP